MCISLELTVTDVFIFDPADWPSLLPCSREGKPAPHATAHNVVVTRYGANDLLLNTCMDSSW